MRYLLTTYTGPDGEGRTYLLKGDRRQTRRRIVRLGLEQYIDGPANPVEQETSRDSEDNDAETETEQANGPMKFRTEQGVYTARVEPLTESETDERKSDYITLIVNENVTQAACRVGYPPSLDSAPDRPPPDP